MLSQLIAKFFSVSPATADFLFVDKKIYLKKILVLLPITLWATLFYQLSPLFMKWSVDALTEQSTQLSFLGLSLNFDSVFKVIIALAVALLSLNLLDIILKYWKDLLLCRLDFDLVHAQEDRFTDFLSHFDGAFLEGENNMRLSTHIHNKLGTLGDELTAFFEKLIKIPIGLLTLVLVLQFMHVYLLLFILGVALVNFFFESYQKNLWRRYELTIGRLEEQKNRLKGWIVFSFSRAHGNGWLNRLWSIYTNKRNQFAAQRIQQSKTKFKVQLASGFFNTFARFAAFSFAGWMIIVGKISLGSFAVFDVYLQRFKDLLEEANLIIAKFFELRFELFRLDFMLNMRPKLDRSNVSDTPVNQVDSVTIKNLSFTYPRFYEEEKAYFDDMKNRLHMLTSDEKVNNPINQFLLQLKRKSFSEYYKQSMTQDIEDIDRLLSNADAAKPVLKGIDYTFSKGKIYSIVGYNGAGKTTLTKLLKRSVDPSEGQVLINDRDLLTIDPETWRGQISSLQQDTLIWPSMSVRDNLLLGIKNKADYPADEMLWAALEQVGLKDEVSELDQIIGENIQFSGGQKQLVELARMILEKNDFIILDEGTTQLDPVKEAGIIKILHEIKKDTIILFITHRMTTAAQSDEIIILQDGQLDASGTHQALLDAPTANLYQTFWNSQRPNK